MFKNFTWGHGVLVALGAFMIFILSMIFIFTRGWQNAEMISDNYYEDELHYQAVINAKNNADALSQKPLYSQSASGIRIDFPKDLKIDNSTVNFHLFRTDDAKLDVAKKVTLDADHAISIPKNVLFPGSYTLKIHWEQNKKPYQVDYDIIWK